MGTVQLRSPVVRETGECKKGAMSQKEKGQTDRQRQWTVVMHSTFF